MDVSSIPILDDHHLPAAARRRWRRRPAVAAWTRPVALGFALATWVVSLFLLVGYLPTRTGDAAFQYVETVDWIPVFGIQYKLGVGRAVGRPGRADDDPVVDLHPGQLQADPDPDQGIHDLVPRPRGRDDRRVPGPGPVPVLHLLGGRPRPDVPDHRDLGRRQPDLRDDQVRPVHARRVAAHARGDPGHGVRLPGGAPAARGSAPSTSWPCAPSPRRPASPTRSRSARSWPSSWPSPSRSRCSRSTPGCPTPTPRRRPRAR